jgi:hypothetical protein
MHDYGTSWVGKDYLWDADAFGSPTYATKGGLSMIVTMYGSLANAHTGITNLQEDHTRFSPSLDRRVDPGAGASSDYVAHAFKTRYAVGAGDELFVTYGEAW